MTVGTGLSSEQHSLSEKELSSLLELITRALRCHNRDQAVVVQLLELLNRFLFHAYRDDSPSFNKCRENIVFVLRVFWKMWRKDASVLPTNCKLMIVKCLLNLSKTVEALEGVCLVQQPAGAGDGQLTLLSAFIQMLQDSSHLVQMQVAEAVKM